ncbi:hypothetical protein PG994_009748 [Apiospora phragmitis]|uniref:Uncharacterized protein n=1 Tax=Apiospora phragmitis TaxID=2905665 RepID=A0ABR1U944_9PEZI
MTIIAVMNVNGGWDKHTHKVRHIKQAYGFAGGTRRTAIIINMCFNNQTYYNCIEKHLRSSEASLCAAPYQCRCWRRHDPDRLKRLHSLETSAPELCPIS